MSEDLQSSHLAELHARAAELDISGYRMLPRAELIEKIAEKQQNKGRRRRLLLRWRLGLGALLLGGLLLTAAAGQPQPR